MARRRFTVKRIDPWSVLKFGALANIALLGIFLLVMAVVWFIVDRLMIVDQICGIATDIGFTQCGLSAGNMFRASLTLGLLWVVVQTAVVVFLAFLHNLIADLTGGVVVAVLDEPMDTPNQPQRVMTAVTAQQVRSTPDAGATAAMPPSDGGRRPNATGRQAPTTPQQRDTTRATPRQSRPAPEVSAQPASRPARRPSEPPASRPRQRRPSADGDELFGGR